MKTSRFVYVLSALLVLVLVCGIVPAAYADNGCICASAQDKNPACTCGCNGDIKTTREQALEQFMLCTIAAEAESDVRRQAQLYRQAAGLWDTYMDMVLSAFGPVYASDREIISPETYGIIGGADIPTEIYLSAALEENCPVYPYDQTAAEAVFDSVPAAPDMTEGQLTPEDEILGEFMMYMYMARNEVDPVLRQQLYQKAGDLWDLYMYLAFGDVGEYRRDAYASDMPMEGQRPDRPQHGGPGHFGPSGNVPAHAPEQSAPIQSAPAQPDPYLDNLDAYNMYIAGVFGDALIDAVADILTEGIIGWLPDAATAPEAAQADPYLNTVDETPALPNTETTDILLEGAAATAAAELPEDTGNQALPAGIGLPTPWTETNSLEEAIRISGVEVTLPAEEELPRNMKLLHYRAVPGTLEVDYGNEEEELMFRASVEDEGYNLSGDYNTYSRTWQAIVGEHLIECLGDGRNMNIALFRDGNTAYAITMACGREGAGLTADEMAAFVLSVLPAAEASADEQLPETPAQQPEEPVQANADNGEIIVLFTGDVQSAIDEGIGYAGVKSIRDSLQEQGYTTILVDGGNAVGGGELGKVSRGEAIIDLMNAVGYDAAIPGELETDYGDEQFFALIKRADFPYISSNFTLDDELVLEPYVIIEASGKKIAFVGVNVTDNDGKYAELLQNAVNDARNNGAEIVYVIGHMTEGTNAADLVAGITGVDVFLDNNGGEAVVLNDKANETVIYSSCGERLSKVGYSRINAAGAVVETGVWVLPEGETIVIDNEITEMVEAAKQKLAAIQNAEADAAKPAPEEESAVPAAPATEPAAESSAGPAAEDWELSDEELAQLKMIVDYLYAMRQAK